MFSSRLLGAPRAGRLDRLVVVLLWLGLGLLCWWRSRPAGRAAPTAASASPGRGSRPRPPTGLAWNRQKAPTGGRPDRGVPAQGRRRAPSLRALAGAALGGALLALTWPFMPFGAPLSAPPLADVALEPLSTLPLADVALEEWLRLASVALEEPPPAGTDLETVPAGFTTAAAVAGSPAPPAHDSRRADPPLPPPPPPACRPAPSPPGLPFLPEWVQPRTAAALWASAGAEGAPALRLPTWTFLRVLGAQRDRLEVEHPGGKGWVGVRDVAPAQVPGRWARTTAQAWLWPSPAATATRRSLPAASLVQVQPQEAANGRVLVRAYDLDGRLLAEGWVALQRLQPVGAPRLPLPKPFEPRPRVSVEKLFGSRQGFVELVGALAREASAVSRIPASLTAAQAILESDWGESSLAREANNYFGIKAHTQIGPAGVVWMPTAEVVNGKAVRVLDVFRAYHDLEGSIADLHCFFVRQPRYWQALLVVGDPAEFTRRIAAAGYSTDPGYPAKLLALVQQYQLTRFDR